MLRVAAVVLSLFAWGAQAQGVSLELDAVVPQPPGPQFPVVADGHVTVVDPDHGAYTADYTWTPLPVQVEGPFSVTLTVKGYASSYIAPGAVLHARGFEVSPDPAQVFVEARDGATVSDSVTVTLTPADWVSPGSVVEIDIGAAYGAFVTYRYVAGDAGANGRGEGDDGVDGGTGAGEDDEHVLDGRIECPSDTIVISALPSLSCEIVISGWRYSADPVEVLLPAVVDGWGNQANGLQSVENGATNAQDPTNWTRPEYRWWLPVFACPSQDTTGANCESFVTLPGPVSMPVILRQRGQADVELILTLNAVGRGGATPLAAGGVVRFGNRGLAGDFLHVETPQLQVGSIRGDWLSALWVIQPVEGTTFVRIGSRWREGVFLHAERGVVEAGTISPDWWSAMWLLEPVEGTRYLRIGNRARPGEVLHMEQSVLALGPVSPDSQAAQWWTME